MPASARLKKAEYRHPGSMGPAFQRIAVGTILALSFGGGSLLFGLGTASLRAQGGQRLPP
jgi:hypothetical protein